MIQSNYSLTFDNRFIDVYDNLFSFSEQRSLYNFLNNFSYRLNGGDDDFYNSKNQIFSTLEKHHLDTFGFCNTKVFQELNNKYNFINKKIIKIRVNVSNSFEYNTIHSDSFAITLLYFANLQWNICDGGHTFFYNQTADNILHACVYKPGRVVVFDGDIPHSISPISQTARAYRYSFVMQFFKNNKE